MSNLDIIRAKVIEAVPSILDLQFGCEVQGKVSQRKSFCIGMALSDKDSMVIGDNCEAHCIVKKNNFKILGRPIQLSDVLLAIGRQNCGELCDIKLFGDGDVARVGFPNLSDDDCKWNLLKSLEDQDESVLSFLADLLK